MPAPQNIVDAALYYASLDIRVFPTHGPHPANTQLCSCGDPTCHDAGKHPRIKAWQRNATTDLQQIKAWWAKWPTANIGIATGDGLLVIDLDNENEMARFKGICLEHGTLPKTAVARTGRGFHIYLWTPDATIRSHKVDSILVRGEGGYVIAPPSFHIKQQRQYEWITPADDIADAPAWVYEWCKESCGQDTWEWEGGGEMAALPAYLQCIKDNTVVNALAAYQTKWTASQEREILSALHTIHPSAKRDIWLQIGMSLHALEWLRPDGTDWGFDQWLAWSEKSADKFVSIHDLETRWRSFKYNGPITIGTLFHYANEYATNPQSFFNPADRPEIARPDDSQDERGRNSDHGPILPYINGHSPQTNGTPQVNGHTPEFAALMASTKPILTPYDGSSDPPPREWLYRYHYIRKNVSATFADSGIGKTALKLTEAVAMATGQDILQIGLPIAPHRILYWNGEDGADEMRRRLNAIIQTYKLPKVIPNLFTLSHEDFDISLATETRNGVVLNESLFKQLSEYVQDYKIDVLFIDPLVSAHEVSENDNVKMNKLMKRLHLFSMTNNCCSEAVHHTKKLEGAEATADSGRGAGAIKAKVRSLDVLNVMSQDEAERIGIPREDSHRYVRIDDGKRNLAAAAKARWVYLESVKLAQGDNVQVPMAWTYVDCSIGPDDIAVLKKIVGEHAYRWDSRAAGSIHHALAGATMRDLADKQERNEVAKILKHAKENNIIEIVQKLDEQRHSRFFVQLKK